jgi:hypothetical protein
LALRALMEAKTKKKQNIRMNGKEVADYLREVGENLEAVKAALDVVYEIGLIEEAPVGIGSGKYAKTVVKLLDNESIFKYYSHLCEDVKGLSGFLSVAKNINLMYGTYVGSNKDKYVSEEYIKKYHASIDAVPPIVDLVAVAVFLSTYVQIKSPNDIIALNKIYLSHRNTIELYCTLLDYYINTEYQKQIIQLVEELKIIILYDGKDVKPNKSNGVQLLLSNYNLVPVLTPLTISEVLQKCFSITTKSDNIELLLEKSQKKEKSKTGLIIINKVISHTNTTYNDISDIIDAKYKKSPKTEGVSLAILKRTNNIVNVEIPKIPKFTKVTKNKSPAMTTYISDADNYYIVDTIDGANYRILHMWNNDAPIPKIMIPAQSPPKKIQYYNRILADNILQHVQKPLIMTDSRADKKQAVIEYKIIRNSVKKIIIANFNKLMGKSQSLTSDRFLTIISSPQIYTSALMYIAELLSQQYLPNSGTSDNFRVDELKMSTISDINYMKTNIIRKNTIDYKKIAQKSVKNPTDVFSKILDSSLAYYINDKSNIFSTLDNKEGI